MNPLPWFCTGCIWCTDWTWCICWTCWTSWNCCACSDGGGLWGWISCCSCMIIVPLRSSLRVASGDLGDELSITSPDYGEAGSMICCSFWRVYRCPCWFFCACYTNSRGVISWKSSNWYPCPWWATSSLSYCWLESLWWIDCCSSYYSTSFRKRV